MVNIASCFLSHSSTESKLVKAVANELGKRGVIAWLDRDELVAGASLSRALGEAINQQATVALFLSPAAIKSRWVEDELSIALQEHDTPANEENIVPVYLGDPLELVKSHPLLPSRWLHPDGDRVDRLGIRVSPDQDLTQQAQGITHDIAKRVYRALGITSQREVILYFDQRGVGTAHGHPELSDNLKRIDAPVLTYRPNPDVRTPNDTLYGEEWSKIQKLLIESLSDALGTPRWSTPKKIRILGNAQLGLVFRVGLHFNRNTTARLFCTNSVDGLTFTNQSQQDSGYLQGGDPNCESSHPSLTSLSPETKLNAIALLLSQKRFVTDVINYLDAVPGSPPLVWVKSGTFESSPQVMEFIANVVALLDRLRDENGISKVYLYCTLPFHVVPLLAANLLHSVSTVIFMEYRRDLQNQSPRPNELYTPLRIDP